MKKRLFQAYRSPIKVYLHLQTLINPLSLLFVKWQARMYGGCVQIDRSARFYHTVRFQGCGTLHVDPLVTFGFYLAGSPGAPILLQPRDPDSVITVGSGTAVMNGCELIARNAIRIGQNCLIGPQTLIYDSDFHEIDPRRRGETGQSAAVTLDDNVWIGSRVIILKGVTIGRDSVVGAGCVVSKSIQAGSIIVGNPMKVIGSVYDRNQSDNSSLPINRDID